MKSVHAVVTFFIVICIECDEDVFHNQLQQQDVEYEGTGPVDGQCGGLLGKHRRVCAASFSHLSEGQPAFVARHVALGFSDNDCLCRVGHTPFLLA